MSFLKDASWLERKLYPAVQCSFGIRAPINVRGQPRVCWRLEHAIECAKEVTPSISEAMEFGCAESTECVEQRVPGITFPKRQSVGQHWRARPPVIVIDQPSDVGCALRTL